MYVDRDRSCGRGYDRRTGHGHLGRNSWRYFFIVFVVGTIDIIMRNPLLRSDNFYSLPVFQTHLPLPLPFPKLCQFQLFLNSHLRLHQPFPLPHLNRMQIHLTLTHPLVHFWHREHLSSNIATTQISSIMCIPSTNPADRIKPHHRQGGTSRLRHITQEYFSSKSRCL